MKNSQFLERVRHNVKLVSATTSIGATSLAFVPVFAAASAEDLVGKMLYYILQIFKYIGILLVVWGIAQLMLAFKNEDADSKSRAMMVLLAAIFLTTISAIAKPVINAVDPSLWSKVKA